MSNLTGHDAIPEQALAWIEAGDGAALATVIETWGSAPRPVGAQLAISASGALAGSVSGGCVEGAVAAEAMEAVGDGRCRVLTYGVSDSDAFAVGLACGGTIRVLVEPVGVGDGPSVALLRELVQMRAQRRAAVYCVRPGTAERALLGAGATPEADRALNDDKSGFTEDGFFLGVHNPPLRMAIIGAAHIAQPLSQMARLTGFDVTVIDPREAFASAERFPGAALSHDWPDAALAAHGLDARVAVVCLTHDPKLDDPALRLALPSPAFYIGALGSKRTHAKRVERLTGEGLPAEAMARLHAPIGMDIGAKSPAEIAVSIMAQITERLRRPETRR